MTKEIKKRTILPGPVRGSISFLLIVLNTLFWMNPLFVFGILKFIIPIPAMRIIFNKGVTFVCEIWNIDNDKILDFMLPTRWEIHNINTLSKNKSYLVISNHQTWIDILVLEKTFLGKIPFLKFFIKKELMKIPVLGFSWWALDFPVMYRYSKEFLEKNPHLEGKDLETTKKACEKFRSMPVSVMNFVEGTRFTPAKHEKQRSPFKHLLRPKAGGTAYVLNALGDQFNSILNVTTVYPGGVKTIWEYLCGEVEEIIVHVEELPMTNDVCGDYFNDAAFQERFQQWVNRLWEKKDKLIDGIMAEN